MRDVAKVALAALVCSMAQGAWAESLDVSLICMGSGVTDSQETATVKQGSDYLNQRQTKISMPTKEQWDAEMLVEIKGDQGRIKLPRQILPTIGSTKEGWSTISKLAVTSDNIEARTSLNMFNKPKLSISRLSGSFTLVSLSSTFQGKCQPYDPDNVKRAF